MQKTRTLLSLLIMLMASSGISLQAQRMLTLDSCRSLALANNKKLLVNADKIEAADYETRAAKTRYLPYMTGDASYIHNVRTINLLSKQQKQAISSLGTTAGGAIQQKAAQIVAQYPDLAPLIQMLGTDAVPLLNGLGSKVVDAFETNTRNIYMGSLTITQPLYVGGRIRAYNNICQYTRRLLGAEQSELRQKTILDTDQAYWQVVSLANKKQLAEKYLAMVAKMDSDIVKMYNSGVTTKASTLTVRVRRNEAEMTLTKVENGLSLARMLLNQLCGLSLDEMVVLADENNGPIPLKLLPMPVNNADAYSNRHDLAMLKQATNIAGEQVQLVRSIYLPQVAMMGTYHMMNPNCYDGFSNRFAGNISIGVSMHVPIWNWFGNRYHVRAAKAQHRAALHAYEEAREMVDLQLRQARFKMEEAAKRLVNSEENLGKAEENLHYADVGFHEGMIPASEFMAAQTAWVEAQSQKLDAEIDVRLTQSTLLKALGIDATTQR